MKAKTKKIFSLSVLVMCIAVFGLVGAASAEDSIEDILDNRYGSGCWQESTVETFLANGGSGGMTATAIVVNSQCGYKNPTGWYVAGSTDPSDRTEMFSDPEPNESAIITTNGAFGLYIDSDGTGTTIYYTETGLNPIEPDPTGTRRQHAKVYEITCVAADYVVAFEDKSPDDSPPWDEDYNDVVIELTDVNPIPEFATIAIPVVGILGLFLFFNHRKRKEE